MADEVIPPYPNLSVSELGYQLLTPSLSHIHSAAQSSLLEAIKADEMGPYYRSLYETPSITINPLASPRIPQSPRLARAQLEAGPLGRRDESLLAQLDDQNQKTLKTLEEKIEEAEKTEGESEIAEAWRAKAMYLTRIGEKDKAIEAQKTALEKTAGVGSRIDIALTLVRIGYFFALPELVKEYLAKAEEFIQKGGDWDRRNRLKVYKAYHFLSIRSFQPAAALLIDSLPTFTATELLPLPSFISLTLICSALTSSRPELQKVLKSPEVQSTLAEIPEAVGVLASSLCDSQYDKFFRSLARIEEEEIRTSRLLNSHRRWFVREMRVKAYAQLLESYKSLTLESLARAFGVSIDWIDDELVHFIAAGRLNCVIDRVHGVVETNRPSTKSARYEAVVKQGDVLLNSVQRLSKVLY
ncbi:putative RPN7-subunit of the regulatory particle of the proteasome [Serendipita vermifera]|nr:putative RPN7-subunit of the regulatory particle of the proteasome [Serendipita vermifera]